MKMTFQPKKDLERKSMASELVLAQKADVKY